LCTFRQFTNFQKRLCFADVRQIRLWNRYLHKTNQTVRCTEEKIRNLLVSPCTGHAAVASSYIPRQDSRSMASASLSSCEGGKIELSESCARRKTPSIHDSRYTFKANLLPCLEKGLQAIHWRASATRRRGVGAWVELGSWQVSRKVLTSKKKEEGMLTLFFKVSKKIIARTSNLIQSPLLG
jgi:hypothetical protein